MEVFNGSITATSKSHLRFPISSRSPLFSANEWANSFKSRRFQCQAHPKLPSQIYYSVPNRSVLRISAQFGRRSNKRNFLRKKLRDDPLKLRRETQNLIVENEDDFRQTNGETSGLVKDDGSASFREIDSVKETNSGRRNGFGESVLWDELESWSEQYKKDIEFWGLGSGPIFTIFRDSNGKVERVVVDENEIMRRSGVLPSEFREGVEFGQVGLKLSYAKYVANEMERGNSVLPESSTVTKFVVSTQSSKLKSQIRDIIFQPSLIPKLSAIGSISVFSLLLIWAVNKLFQKGKNKELTRSEKEMMSRKMKSRKEKEMSMKGSVEVVQDSIEPDTTVYERPPLDMDELLNSIRNEEGSSYQLSVLDGSLARDSASSNMDEKVQEISEMARHARKMEVEATAVPVNHSKNDVGPAQKQEPPDLNPLNDEPHEISGKLKSAAFVVQNKVIEQKLACDVKSSQDASEEFEAGISNMLTAESGKSSVCNEVESKSELNNVDSTNNSSVSGKEATLSQGKSMRKKLRVIRSVTEAREYLSSKQHEQAVDNRPLESDMKNQKEDLAPKVGAEELPLGQSSHQLVSEDNVHNASNWTGISNESPGMNISDKLSIEVNEDTQNTISLNGKAKTPFVSTIAEDSSVYTRQNVDGEPKMAESSRSASSVSTVGSNMNTNPYKKFDDAQENNRMNADINGLNMEVRGTKHGINTYKPVPTKEDVDSYGRLENGRNGVNTSYVFGSEVSDPISASTPQDSGLKDKVCFRETGAVQEKDCINARITGLSMEVQGTEHGTPAHEPDSDSNQNLGGGESDPDIINDFSSDGSGQISAILPLDDSSQEEKLTLSAELDNSEPEIKDHDIDDVLPHDAAKKSVDGSDKSEKEQAPADKGTWMEKNFNEFLPVVEKIAAGFSKNYASAREKASQGSGPAGITELMSIFDDSEFEWMKDDHLREVVFRVRDNELAGREPFHLLSAEDKLTFFKGLEEKAEKVNESVAGLHAWLHSNIENLDYGADGISIYDPPEKMTPRWKGPSVETIRELLHKTIEERFRPSTSTSTSTSKSSSEDLSNEKVSPRKNSKAPIKVTRESETVIQSSDGSVRPGKKSGKEQWEHTKKWSKEFLEAYNAETDPEVKAIMRDMGKDLDRWVTEEDIKKARLLKDKIPSGVGKHILDKKLNKLKREVEQFGQKAVVEKYTEYGETEEEDYLWWLDLPYVLCIEMNTRDRDSGEEKIGFYTVEMAKDLELEPKPHHVIAFQDPGNCKNFCHIMQTHMEMLGLGKAYVVAQPPKDVYHGAKDNGFGVTVIRKGELVLNVDQPLEEVEELISEIGSKMYEDKIMKERGISMRSVMKGMSASSKAEQRRNPKKRRRKIMLKKPKKV